MTLEQFLEQTAAGLPPGSVWMLAVSTVGGLVASAVCPCTLPVGIGIAGVAGASESQVSRAVPGKCQSSLFEEPISIREAESK
jgi:cytochrome c-type biogenesis protein